MTLEHAGTLTEASRLGPPEPCASSKRNGAATSSSPSSSPWQRGSKAPAGGVSSSGTCVQPATLLLTPAASRSGLCSQGTALTRAPALWPQAYHCDSSMSWHAGAPAHLALGGHWRCADRQQRLGRRRHVLGKLQRHAAALQAQRVECAEQGRVMAVARSNSRPPWAGRRLRQPGSWCACAACRHERLLCGTESRTSVLALTLAPYLTSSSITSLRSALAARCSAP